MLSSLALLILAVSLAAQTGRTDRINSTGTQGNLVARTITVNAPKGN